MHLLSPKRLDALDEVDRMPGDLRQCVHEFGLPIVSVLRKHGIRNPRHIREIVREIWHGPRQYGQTGGTMATVDTLLVQGRFTLAGLSRFLGDNNYVIAPCEPTRKMLDASMAEVTGGGERMTKEEKHRRRLRAALRSLI